MKGNGAFLDTNVLIYAFAAGHPNAPIAESLLAAGCVLGVQSLNEFVAVALRKLAMPWRDLLDALAALRVFCPAPVPLTLATHEAALAIAQRYGYLICDSLVIAAAIDAHCTVLYSEDLHDGQKIGELTIRNPFAVRRRR